MTSHTTTPTRPPDLTVGQRLAHGALFLGGLTLSLVTAAFAVVLHGFNRFKQVCDPAVVLGCTQDFEDLGGDVLLLAAVALLVAGGPAIVTAVSGRPRPRRTNVIRTCAVVLAGAAVPAGLVLVAQFS
ncbi:hypothetical protein [Euzebya tangerina]|uniref:hypothetical protein n=1 Tax=Euzebya tangerina TaxID=591198 RepID=UPI0013C353F2|nr:hypothetical protein [Euzebya tangerina]